jgi:hypothetical protein
VETICHMIHREYVMPDFLELLGLEALCAVGGIRLVRIRSHSDSVPSPESLLAAGSAVLARCE